MKKGFKNILFLAPHTDDAELGCGGTIARLLEEKCNVFVVAFSTAEESLPEGSSPGTLSKEFYCAMRSIGVPENNVRTLKYPVRRLSYYRQDVLEDLVKLRKELLPDLVFVPAKGDLHQDHEVLHNESLRAFKDMSILGYELPWNHITFSAQFFIVLKEHHLNEKLKALQEYKTQIQLQRNYFTKEFIQGLASVRGTQVKEKWAEAFEVLRLKM